MQVFLSGYLKPSLLHSFFFLGRGGEGRGGELIESKKVPNKALVRQVLV